MDNFKTLKKQPNNFINIIFDNWRGWCSIFDTTEVRNCKNNCTTCPLYLLLKKNNLPNELYPASKKDKKIFGPQNFLNCKTIKQYINCYVNFLDKKCQTKKQIEKELSLIQNSQVIYSKDNGWDSKKFKKTIIQKAKKKIDKNKNEIIQNYLTKNKNFFN